MGSQDTTGAGAAAASDSATSGTAEAAEGARPASRNELICLALVVALAAAIRLVQGFSASLFGDELWTYVGATHGDLSGVFDWVRSDEEITPPLFTVLAWASAKLGDATVMIRLPSMLAGVALIPTIFEIGRRTLGPRVGLLAALLATLNPFLIWYSVEARAYSLVLLLVTLSTLSLLIAVERRETRWWVAYAALTCAAMYTHYTALYVLFAQLVWVALLERPALKAAVVANACAVLAFLPWLPGFTEDLDSPTRGIIGVIAPFSLENFLGFTASAAFGHQSTFRGFWGTGGALLLAAGFAVAAVALAQRYLKTRRIAMLEEPQRRYLILFAMLALAAPLGVALASIVGDDMFTPRNLITSAAGFALVAAAILASGSKPLRWIAAGIVVAMLCVGTVRTFDAKWQRPQFEEMAQYLDENAAPDDVVVSVPGIGYLEPPEDGPLLPPTQSISIHSDSPHAWFYSVSGDSVAEILDASADAPIFLAGDPYSVGLARAALGLEDVQPTSQTDFEGLVPMTIQEYESRRPR
ncbi:MAG: glycosyltransferase family 39 protein [Solirubrobacterales bacterium]